LSYERKFNLAVVYGTLGPDVSNPRPWDVVHTTIQPLLRLLAGQCLCVVAAHLRSGEHMRAVLVPHEEVRGADTGGKAAKITLYAIPAADSALVSGRSACTALM